MGLTSYTSSNLTSGLQKNTNSEAAGLQRGASPIIWVMSRQINQWAEHSRRYSCECTRQQIWGQRSLSSSSAASDWKPATTDSPQWWRTFPPNTTKYKMLHGPNPANVSVLPSFCAWPPAAGCSSSLTNKQPTNLIPAAGSRCANLICLKVQCENKRL